MKKSVFSNAVGLLLSTMICFSCAFPVGCRDVKPEKVFNHYKGKDGGYVAVYTRNMWKGMYRINGGIYVAGLIRVKGRYEGTTFIPQGYRAGADITQDKGLKELASQYLKMNPKDVWFGGDTGGFKHCRWAFDYPKHKVRVAAELKQLQRQLGELKQKQSLANQQTKQRIKQLQGRLGKQLEVLKQKQRQTNWQIKLMQKQLKL
jgi:hypothetical protein